MNQQLRMGRKKKKYRRGFLSCMFFILFSAKKERKKNGDDECARRKIHGLRKRRRMENSIFPNVSQGRVSVGNGENSVDFQGKVAIREDVWMCPHLQIPLCTQKPSVTKKKTQHRPTVYIVVVECKEQQKQKENAVARKRKKKQKVSCTT